MGKLYKQLSVEERTMIQTQVGFKYQVQITQHDAAYSQMRPA